MTDTTAGVLLLLLAGLKFLYAFRLRIDSDETQHLHVVWSWTQHQLPYRDVFDNHSPFFQFLCAPFFALCGERADIVILMRILTVPLYCGTLWLAYRIARRLWPHPAAMFATICAGAFPIFFVKSSEFRPDDLWAPLFLLSILAFMTRPFRNREAFFGGLALGACFITTMKTSALAISLGVSALLLLAYECVRAQEVSWRSVWQRTAVLLVGCSLPPAAVVLFFAAHHALPALYYGTIAHNLTPTLFRPQYANRFGVMAPMFALALLGGACAWSRATEPQRRSILMLVTTCTVYLALIMFVWPLVEPHDILPVAPIALLFLIPLSRSFFDAVGDARAELWQQFFFPAVTLVEMATLLLAYSPLRGEIAAKISFIHDVLRLTGTTDFVMDAKGESIFRRRPFFYALEGITLRRIELGLVPDDIPARLIETRTPVATTLRMPWYACDFIEQNYVPVAFRLRVLGQNLGLRPNESAPFSCKIDIVIPNRYTIVAEHGAAGATVDDVPLRGSRYLDAGSHDIVVNAGHGQIDLIWADAAEKNFSPFAPLASDSPGSSD
jgi:hypothetical protein